MNKLDEIEASVVRTYGGERRNAIMALEYAELLIRAVKQLGTERQVFQKLYEAVDDNYLEMAEARPDIYSALKDVSDTAEPDPDVLELIEEADNA